MSEFITKKMVCPSCNHADTIRIYEAIDTEDKTAVKKLMDGSLFEYGCPKCNYKTQLLFNLLYKDNDNQFMVYLAADENVHGMRKAMDKIEEDFNALSPNKELRYSVTRRMVTKIEDLLEKIIIFNAGLDDRIISIMKYSYMLSVKKAMPECNVVNCWFAVHKKKWRFEFFTSDGRWFTIDLNEDTYKNFVDTYSRYFSEHNEYFVDDNYAMDLYVRVNDDSIIEKTDNNY